MKLPDFSYEEAVFKKGYRVIAGLDEVGRGSFAGPVVAAAVVFAKDGGPVSRQPRIHPQGDPGFGAPRRLPPLNQDPRIVINDSKKLSAKQRELASFWIKKKALCYGIGSASVTQINKMGIKKASEIAFREAIKNCNRNIDYLLIDVFLYSLCKRFKA